MTALSPPMIAAALVALVVGLVSGWLFRTTRARREKVALNAGWQHQIDAQQNEKDRLAAQNTSLMEQVSQGQARNAELRQRIASLDADREAADARRNEIEREIREIRGNLELVVRKRDRLRSDAASAALRNQAISSELKERDAKIARLKRELGRWQERVPPLVERYRERDREARELDMQLERAEARIAEFESRYSTDDTQAEPLGDAVVDNLDASNEGYEDTLAVRVDKRRDASPDDLQRIRGIGPAIEKTLQACGIRSLEDLASLSGDDIERIGASQRGLGARIEREDWIGQARRLLDDAP